MYKSLSPQTIGIRGLSLQESIDLARDSGFDGVSFDLREASRLAEEHGLQYVRDLFERAGVRPSHWGLPVAWQNDEQWQVDLRELPKLAGLARDLDCPRTTIPMPSGSDDRPYKENFAWHVARFRPIAEILRDAGCRFGIEFIGPKTYRAKFKHEFIFTLDGLMELAGAIGTGNVGLLLDAWHLYTSGGTVADLDRIGRDDIVVVHVNDAPPGIPRDEQIDTVRRLPMETNVIDLPAFMSKLQTLGYDGPVTPEPFSKRLNDVAASDPLAAAREASRSMDALWRAAALA